MDLTRRGFLQVIGLGGVALTVPKPFKVVAAKMADLERPPLHVGTAEIGPVDGFTMHRLSLSADRLTEWEDYRAFGENWIFTMTFRSREGKLGKTVFLNTPAANVMFMPFPKGFLYHMGAGEFVQRRHLHMETGYRFDSGQVIEAWLVPVPPGLGEEESRPPLRPMPETTLILEGIMEREGDFFNHRVQSNFSKVRLERTRAIELGLVEPEEEEETWQNLASR